jgi:predicted DNA-binding protein with PD1-like motif
VIGGLADFAAKNHLQLAHFTGIGALDAAVIGWGDPVKKGLKVVRLNEEMEVTSFTGDIRPDIDGKPRVHGHIVVGLLRNGAVYAGHLLQGHVSIVLDVHLDAFEGPLRGAAE